MCSFIRIEVWETVSDQRNEAAATNVNLYLMVCPNVKYCSHMELVLSSGPAKKMCIRQEERVTCICVLNACACIHKESLKDAACMQQKEGLMGPARQPKEGLLVQAAVRVWTRKQAQKLAGVCSRAREGHA